MTNNQLTDELRAFYVAYYCWINAGARTSKIFCRTHGLCVNAYDYFFAIGVDGAPHLDAMHAAFVAAGMDEELPFNSCPEQYIQEQHGVNCHLNPARLAWVASELQERRKAAAPELNPANLANKFYERYPLATFKSDGERAEAFGYFMAGAELQCFGEFIKYEDLCCDE